MTFCKWRNQSPVKTQVPALHYTKFLNKIYWNNTDCLKQIHWKLEKQVIKFCDLSELLWGACNLQVRKRPVSINKQKGLPNIFFFSKNLFTQWPKNIVNTYDFITILNHALFYFGVFEWAGKGDVFIQE